MKLSLPQQDIYYEQLLYPDDAIYNIGAKIKIEGVLDIPVFKEAYRHLIEQHDAFRTILKGIDDEVFSEVLEEPVEALPYIDFSAKANAEEAANAFMQNEFLQAFDILNGRYLHRFILLKVDEEVHYLFSVYHHIITDGWGTSLMFQRLVRNYNELIEEGAIISTYPFTYRDFVEDDDAYQMSQDYQEDKAYWMEKFSPLPENLFEKINKAPDKINRSDRKAIYIPREQYNQLDALANELKASTFHLIVALVFIYFSRKQNNTDFAIGLPVLNRGKAVFKKTVGLFMGVSLLRMHVDPAMSFPDFVTAIKNQLRYDYRHQRFPLGKLIHELQGFQEKERLFNLTLSYEKQNYADHFQHAKTTVIPLTHQSERVALAVYVREFDEQEDVKIDFDYNLNYFDLDSITAVLEHFKNLVEQVIHQPDKKLGDFDLLTKNEAEQLLTNFNDTISDLPAGISSFLTLFAQQTGQLPKQIAVEDAHQCLSYEDLNILSDKIAQYLLNCENNKRPVGVLMERSVFTIAVLLGILKAGKPYIPLDPTFPLERLQHILQHSGLVLLISDQPDKAQLFPSCTILALEDILAKSEEIAEVKLPKVEPTDTAYIIYTSGSTGKPKGVEIGHAALLNFLCSMQQRPGLSSVDRLFAVTTYSFDISILEFFLPLIAGASLFIADNATLQDYQKTIQRIKAVDPTVIQATPSFFQLLINGGWTGNRHLSLFCGGDLLSEELADQLLRNCTALWNMYGPTETTIWSSVKHITESSQAGNIGKPIANTQFYVLDGNLRLLPVGSNGILYIGGEGLAKGYFKDPELTEQKFVPSPFGKGRLFNTNDLVRRDAHGELTFLGRNDNQVKIRGYRIELGEIEAQLHQIPEIQQAVVVAKKQHGQEAFLIAYIIKQTPQYNLQDCLPVLEKNLPGYMIPYTLIAVDEFPLTPNKKIDRKALAQQVVSDVADSTTGQVLTGSLQRQLASFWQEVLRYKNAPGPNDNFFSLGGHSLNAVKLTQLINSRLNYNIGLKSIFDNPTIEALARHLSDLEKQAIAIPQAVPKAYYTVTPAQYNLWLAAQDARKSIAYNMVAAFNVEGKLDPDRVNQAVQQLMAQHEILRTNFVEKDGNVYQFIKSLDEVKFQLTTTNATEDTVKEVIAEYINQAFDLERDMLVKMRLIQIDDQRSCLIFCTHHLIMDGTSLEFFTKAFLAHYDLTETSSDREPSGIQFKDYAEWLSAQATDSVSLGFWEQYLAGYQTKEAIAPDAKDLMDATNGAYLENAFLTEETLAVQQLASRHGSTPHTVLAALLQLMVCQVSGHRDLIIGTVNSARNIRGTYSLIGMLVKTLPLRIQLTENMSFLEVLTEVQNRIVQLDQHQDLPLSYRKETLFDLIMTYQNTGWSFHETLSLDDVKLQYVPVDTAYSRMPLVFNFFEVHQQLNLRLSYNAQNYQAATVEFLMALFKRLLNIVVQNPQVQFNMLDNLVTDSPKSAELDFDFQF